MDKKTDYSVLVKCIECHGKKYILWKHVINDTRYSEDDTCPLYGGYCDAYYNEYVRCKECKGSGKTVYILL